MISIAIPVFNTDVTRLVHELSTQLSILKQEGEIIVMEDGSDMRYAALNKQIASLPFVRYIVRNNNQGRVKIRQQLADMSGFGWLLFLDGDSRITADNFLCNYFSCTGSQADVIVGGRMYESKEPADCSLRLHWKYGTVREAPAIAQRNRHPYAGFMSNNFLIRTDIFRRLEFSDSLEGYGHEDTWIGIQLEKLGVTVKYIDNPIIHEGVEPAAVFLRKTENALMNLRRLCLVVSSQTLRKHVKLYRVYYRLAAWHILWLPLSAYQLLRGYIARNLVSCNPSLWLFDLYRLQRFIRMLHYEQKINPRS